MKVICKKILVSMILIVMLFNCIFGTNTSFAGTAEEWINSITNAIGGIVSVMYWPLRIKMRRAVPWCRRETKKRSEPLRF